MTNIEKIKQLAGAVDTDLQEEVESVILNAGKYVAAVTTMECASLNLQNRKGEDYRSEVSRTDAARSRAHNAFIDSVNFTNKLADSFGVEKIYTGAPERRDYADFAFAIVKEIYDNRQ